MDRVKYNTKHYGIYRVPKCDVIKLHFCNIAFSWPCIIGRTWWKTLTHQIHESVHDHGDPRYDRTNIYRPMTLISIGIITYSFGHISDPHEPIPTKFELWKFFIMLYRYMVFKTMKCEKKNKVSLWRHHFGTLLRSGWWAQRNDFDRVQFW